MAIRKERLSISALRTVSVTALTVGALALAAPAFAQDTAGDGEDAGVRTLATVTVVAQKREQNILEVPVAVSAVSAEALENAGVGEFSDLSRVSPSLTINEGDNTNNSSINLRGIGTYAFSIGVEPAVSVIVDDVPVVQQAQAFNTLNDIERVEVLRGPQGTLFGKNASAGVINIVTQGPSAQLSGSLEGILTDDDEVRINASLSGPLSESAGFRINAYSQQRDGHITNLTDGSDLNGDEGWGVRGKFTADLSDAVSSQLILDYSERDVDGIASTFLDIPAGAALVGFFPTALFTSGITPGTDNFNVRLDDAPFSNNEQFLGALKFNVDLGEFELVSITSYQDWSYEFGTDVDGTDFNLAGAFSMGVLSGGIAQGGPFSAEQWTQEFRLVSPTNDKFDYLLGLWFSDAETSRSFSRGPLFGADWNAETSTQNLAAFAQGTVHLDEKWDLTAGLRLGEEEIEATFNDIAAGMSFNGSDSESSLTGRIALQRYFDNGLTAFASIATGYKGQGYDISSGFNQSDADNPVGSEDSISYELGIKGLVNNGRTQFSLVGFLTDYEDFQAQSTQVVNNVLVLNLNNVGELRTQGIEFDLASQLNDNWRIDLGAALIDATIESFPGAECYPGQTVALGCIADPVLGNVQDLSGEDLANSPDLKFTIGATYEGELGWNDIQLYANANYTYQDDVNFDLFADPLAVQDGYGLFNASIGFADADNKYRLTFFGQNLFEEDFASSIANISGLYGNASNVLTQIKPRNSQRYVGVRLKGSF